MRGFSFSTAERWALGIAAVVLLLHASGLGDAFEYRRALLATEPWRLLTGHLVHINWPHAVINAAALLIVARLFAPDLSAPRQLVVLLSAGVVIGLGLAALAPGILWYRGLSGVLHALFFAGAAKWLFSVRQLTAARPVAAGRTLRRRLDQGRAGTARGRRAALRGLARRRRRAAGAPARCRLRLGVRTTACAGGPPEHRAARRAEASAVTAARHHHRPRTADWPRTPRASA